MKVLVSGGRKFADRELMDRALDKLHRLKRIECLITGEFEGAQQLAFYWAKRARISSIIVVPMQPDLTGRLDWSRWNRDIVQRFPVDGLVIFPGRAETHHLAEFAEDNGLRVWRVKADWRG